MKTKRQLLAGVLADTSAKSASAIAVMVVAAFAAGCSNGSGSGGTAPPVNAAPTVSAIASQAIDQGTSTGPLAFTVSDESADALTVTATTSDMAIVPVGSVAFGGSGFNRTVTITPLEDATGQVNVTITARDKDGLSFDRVVPVTVRAVQQSFLDAANTSFAQLENDTPTPVSGVTFVQDADDEATFDSLLQ